MVQGVFGFELDNWYDDRLVQIEKQAEPNEFGRKVLEFIHCHTLEELKDMGHNILLADESDEDVLDFFKNPNKNSYIFADAEDFIKDSKNCEYGYIIDLYARTFEFWEGNQTVADPSNRYGDRNMNGYYPCRLMFSIPLTDIMADDFDMDKMVDKMEHANMTIECFQQFLEMNDCDIIIEEEKNRHGRYYAELQLFSEDEDETDFPVEYDGTVENLIQELTLSLKMFDADECAYSSIVDSVNPTIAEMEYYCSNATLTKQICNELVENIEKMFVIDGVKA